MKNQPYNHKNSLRIKKKKITAQMKLENKVACIIIDNDIDK